MNKQTRTYHFETLSLSPLKLVLHEAKRVSPPDTCKPQTNTDEQMASTLIENVKKQYRRPSPFSNWMGQPFPNEYKEMVAADV